MTTPEEAVRVARGDVKQRYGSGSCACDSCLAKDDAILDALLTAERARLAARVEGMREKAATRRDALLCYDGRSCKAEDREFDALTAVLALLREPA